MRDERQEAHEASALDGLAELSLVLGSSATSLASLDASVRGEEALQSSNVFIVYIIYMIFL